MRSLKSISLAMLSGALLASALASAPALAQGQPPAGYEGEAYGQPGPLGDPNGMPMQDPNGMPMQDPNAMPMQDPNAMPMAQGQPQGVFSFMGGHPIPYDRGGGFCQAQGVHQHDYPPFDSHLFREVNGAFVFVGDPGDFGYNSAYMYSNNHPFDAYHGGGYCYIGWPHRHLFGPASAGYVQNAGYYNYVAPFGADYWAPRTTWLNYYNGYYRTNYWGGRYWSVRPRPIYLGGLGWRGGYGGYGGYYQRPAWGGGYRGAAPVYGGYHAAPVYGGYRGAPVYRGAPAYRAPAAVYRAAAPAYHAPAAMYHAAPAYHAPAARSGGGGGHGGGGHHR